MGMKFKITLVEKVRGKKEREGKKVEAKERGRRESKSWIRNEREGERREKAGRRGHGKKRKSCYERGKEGYN